MVVFTCNHCGESVHKPAVEKHYNFACRKYKDLTCVDCFKDFRGEEYSVHTKCLTEDERYAAKGSMPIGVQKKGEAKQDAWVEMIRAIIQEDINMKPQNKNLLLTISKHNNVPRKKQKFLNYIKSATGGKVSENTISDVWDIIESYKEKHVKLNKTKNENDKKEEENHSNSETIKMKNGESGAEKAPKTTKRKDVNDSIEVASPKKKSKTEKLKAAKETETVEVEKNSSEICRVNQKRKENDIDGDNEIKQKKNKTLETNYKLEENSTSKKKKQKVTDKTETSLKNEANQENASLKANKKKKNKNTVSEKTNSNGGGLELDEKISEINEQNLTQLNESSLIENSQENSKSFIIEDMILNIMKKYSEISIVKLEKKITTKYIKHTQEAEVPQKFVKKFHKKLKKCEKVEIADNIVKLKNVFDEQNN